MKVKIIYTSEEKETALLIIRSPQTTESMRSGRNFGKDGSSTL